MSCQTAICPCQDSFAVLFHDQPPDPIKGGIEIMGSMLGNELMFSARYGEETHMKTLKIKNCPFCGRKLKE